MDKDSQEGSCLICQEEEQDKVDEISLVNTTDHYHTTSKVTKDTTQIQTY